MKSKKLLAVLLSCACVASALTGCGNEEESVQQDPAKESSVIKESSSEVEPQSSEAASEEFDPRSITEGVKLTIATKEYAKVEDFNTNEQTLELEEKFGVDIEFVTFPASDYANKLNVMVNGGDTLPDIIFDVPSGSYLNWANEGAIIPLNEFYENPDYSVNIRKASEATGVDIATQLTQADGYIYALPQLNQTPASQVYIKLWVYEPWLEELGLDMPKTTEGFYEACKAVVANDMNGNGKADELGYIGSNLTVGSEWFKYLMNPFIYAGDSEYRVLEDGQISFAYTTEEWKEGLKYVKKFFDEGLIPVQVLSQDKAGYEAMLLAEEQVTFAFCDWKYSGDVSRGVGYTHVSALEGPTGAVNGFNNPGKPTPDTVITADCENPEAAFIVLDYMCSEEFSISDRYGVRGQDWDYWEDAKIDNKDDYVSEFPGTEIAFIAYDDATFFSSNEVQNRALMKAGPMVISQEYMTCKAMLKEGATEEENLQIEFTNKVNQAVLDGQKVIREEVISNLPLTAEETEEIVDAKATLSTYVIEMTSAFLSGNKDIDAEWDAYLAELDKIGYKEVLEVYQTAYDRLYK